MPFVINKTALVAGLSEPMLIVPFVSKNQLEVLDYEKKSLR